MIIYNTLTEKKEEIKKPRRGKLKLFVCGLTVYDYAHIGHAKTYIFFDQFVKYLRKYKKTPVYYVQNVTDIDDRIITRAQEANKKPFEIADFFEKEYKKDMKALNVSGVNIYIRGRNFLDEIQNQIQRLIKKELVYKTSNGLYFEVKKFPEYGKLSKQNLDALRPGWRIEPDPKKKDPIDFAVWKFAKTQINADRHAFQLRFMEKVKQVVRKNKSPRWVYKKPVVIDGEPAWWSPWGWGRPGWHIEDTAITEKILGPHYDLHGGASDIKFPHHESEIAQQESISGKNLSDIWIHTGLLLVNGEKMSKSLGNFITIRDFLKEESANVMRFLFALHYYRQPFDFTDSTVMQARESLLNITKYFLKSALVKRSIKDDKHIAGEQFTIKVTNIEDAFFKALDDDFNTPQALAQVFLLLNHLNDSWGKLSLKELNIAESFLKKVLDVIGIKLSLKIPKKINDLAKKRELFRRNKQFIQSDHLRKEINLLGYGIEDTNFGPLVWPKNVQ